MTFKTSKTAFLASIVACSVVFFASKASAAVVLHPTDQASWQAWEAAGPGGGYVGGYPVFANNGGAQLYSQSGFSGTMYVSFMVSGTTGHVLVSKYTGSNSNTVFSVPTTTIVHYTNTFSSGDYLQYVSGATNWVSATDAKTTFFCVSSTSYAECDALVPQPPPGPWEQVLASSTPGTTTAQLIGSTTFGLAIIIFIMSLGLVSSLYFQFFRDKKRPWQ